MSAGAVTGDQHRDLLSRQSRLFGNAAAFARRARQLALAFEALQEKDLVNLRDASKRLIFRLVLRLQKTMAPLEGGVLVDFARLGGLAHRQRLIERLRKAEPALLLAQPCQRRAGQRIEGALAINAVAARQAVPLPAPAFNAARAAVRAFGIVLEALVQNTLHFVTIAALLQCRDHLLSLRVRQFRHQFIKPLQKLAMLHRAPSRRIRAPRMPSDCGRNLRTTQTALSQLKSPSSRYS